MSLNFCKLKRSIQKSNKIIMLVVDEYELSKTIDDEIEKEENRIISTIIHIEHTDTQTRQTQRHKYNIPLFSIYTSTHTHTHKNSKL